MGLSVFVVLVLFYVTVSYSAIFIIVVGYPVLHLLLKSLVLLSCFFLKPFNFIKIKISAYSFNLLLLWRCLFGLQQLVCPRNALVLWLGLGLAIVFVFYFIQIPEFLVIVYFIVFFQINIFQWIQIFYRILFDIINIFLLVLIPLLLLLRIYLIFGLITFFLLIICWFILYFLFLLFLLHYLFILVFISLVIKLLLCLFLIFLLFISFYKFYMPFIGIQKPAVQYFWSAVILVWEILLIKDQHLIFY